MKKRILFSSILTIAVCVSLIAGSTLALFESTQTTNMVVSAGNVEVTAKILKETLVENVVHGEVELVDNKLSISQMLPGDSVTFDVGITNSSTIPLDYTIELIDNGVPDSTTSLVNALAVTVEIKNADEDVVETIRKVGGSCDFVTGKNDSMVNKVSVTIEFPDGETNNSFKKASANMSVVLYAVQRAESTTQPTT